MMINKQIRTVILVEIKESIRNSEFIISNILNVLIFTVIGLCIANFLDNTGKLIAYTIIILSTTFSISILSLTLLIEKFWKIKIGGGFYPLLTLPLSLKHIWFGKIISIFILTYPSAAMLAVILITTYSVNFGLNPFIILPLTSWILIFIITPLFSMVYNLIASWIILKFNNPRIIEILQYIPIAIFIFLLISYSTLSEHVIIVNLTHWTMIIRVVFIIGIISIIMYYLIINLRKENVLI